ncbi:hypothetical protein COCMIDRAFT_25449 [Bipolaris oryzae ATCC 44560]|uniref:Uncharacterized protein n=1 Tax=Bipolaris oryzae ATCC 44560 TaxID=930090 RepID=W6Z9M6_COCMI|nr:uncharacterized protein COCMIDRAFT_25449 [Bipolaris oryzae ATCC 44560]EUC46488.1 hypothetical protein COCMIDRAFT_25449 [Bipolaris oryzae ATCC 44560]
MSNTHAYQRACRAAWRKPKTISDDPTTCAESRIIQEYGPVIVRAAAIDARRLDSSATTSHEKRGFLLESDGTGSQAEFDKRGLQFSDDRTEKRAPREEADKRAAREETD